MERQASVLFLCIGNSARSQIAEALMRSATGFRVMSAGTDPASEVHPDALATLHRHQIDATGLHPKDVGQFKGQAFDYVILLCDRMVEPCPVHAYVEVMHWRFPDPTLIEDKRQRARAFEDLFAGLCQRIRLLTEVHQRRRGAHPHHHP